LAGGDGADSDLVGATGQCTGKAKAGVVSKGIELEASFAPADNFMVDLGYTLANSKYRDNISGADGRPLTTGLFLLPGSQLSNAPKHNLTGGVTWTPQLTASGIRALLHTDFRFQSDFSTGSDLLFEKAQQAIMLVNARLGLTGADARWSLEFWAQNLLDQDYRQTTGNAPFQGGGSLATVSAGGTSPGNQLFLSFPAEPRLYGVTVRTKF
jgi:iron complex outermembrane recepter protein